MSLLQKIKRLERDSASAVRCACCRLPRLGMPVGMALEAVGPSVITHMREITPYPPVVPCGLCGRRTIFEIPVPQRARAMEEQS